MDFRKKKHLKIHSVLPILSCSTLEKLRVCDDRKRCELAQPQMEKNGVMGRPPSQENGAMGRQPRKRMARRDARLVKEYSAMRRSSRNGKNRD